MKNNSLSIAYTKEDSFNVSDLIEMYLEGLKTQSTKENYLIGIRQFSEYIYKSFNISNILDIKPQHMVLYARYLESEKGYSTATIYQKLQSVSSLFKFFLKNNYTNTILDTNLNLNPIDNIKNIFLTKDEVKQLLTHIKYRIPRKGEPLPNFIKIRDLTLFSIEIQTGLRAEEICSLKEQNITDEGRILLYKDRGITTKNKRDFNTQLSDENKKLLKQYLVIKEETFGYTEYIFVSYRGNKLCDKSLNDSLKKYLKEIKIDNRGVTFHSLRHTFAYLVMQNNGTLKELQRLLNHKSIRTTERYTHSDDSVFEKTNFNFFG